MELFEKEFEISWADVDMNAHVRHSVYLDWGADVRLAFFSEKGFPMKRWAAYGGAPVLLEQNIKYHREVFFQERVKVNLLLQKPSPDPRFFFGVHEVFKMDGTKAATITLTVAYMDVKLRKLAPAPDDLRAIFTELPTWNPSDKKQ